MYRPRGSADLGRETQAVNLEIQELHVLRRVRQRHHEMIGQQFTPLDGGASFGRASGGTVSWLKHFEPLLVLEGAIEGYPVIRTCTKVPQPIRARGLRK